MRSAYCIPRHPQHTLQPQQTTHRSCTRELAHGHRRRRLGFLSPFISPLATLCLNNRNRLLLSLSLS
jgi:hypothetical protein